MTLIEIINDTDLPPSKKKQLIDAIEELERLKVILKGYDREKKYLSFPEAYNPLTHEPLHKGTTKMLWVKNQKNHFLGQIQWHGPYRGYGYVVETEIGAIIFDSGCLFEIISKINSMNNEHRVGKKI
jgi:hypothetical protein